MPLACRSRRAGVTLIEMMVVISLVAILAGISFPAVTSGLDSMRLSQATDQVVAFLNAGLNRAERRQEGMEVVITPAAGTLELRGVAPGPVRSLALPDGVRIVTVHPVLDDQPREAVRTFLLLPGGTVPRLGVELANRRGVRRIVRVDPISGVPEVERVAESS